MRLIVGVALIAPIAIGFLVFTVFTVLAIRRQLKWGGHDDQDQ